jgi:hypothetical protein
MIFDSPAMNKFLKKYEHLPDYDVPRAVHLARNPYNFAERQHIENLVALASDSPKKQNSWKTDLTGTDDGNFLGSWFEIILFGWLRQHGKVTVSPHTADDDPDFELENANYNQPIIVEARARLQTHSDYRVRLAQSCVIHSLEKHPYPYNIIIEEFLLGKKLDLAHFENEALKWLPNILTQPTFTYNDSYNSKITLSFLKESTTTKKMWVGECSTPYEVDSSPLTSPIEEKASQHKRIAQRGHPYIIAILIDDPKLTHEEVTEVWFGSPAVGYNPAVAGIIWDIPHNKDGLHFEKDIEDVKYTNVSGTLVFKSDYSNEHYLRAWYVENPFAATPIPANLFDVEDAYIAFERNPKNFRMQWQSKLMPPNGE